MSNQVIHYYNMNKGSKFCSVVYNPNFSAIATTNWEEVTCKKCLTKREKLRR